METTNKRAQRNTGSRQPLTGNPHGAAAKRPGKWHLAGAVAAAVVLAACDVKDPIHDTPHPEHGTVTLTADWSRIGEGLTAPDGYTVTAGGYTATFTAATNRLDHLFEPGRHTVYAWNTAEHITVSGTVVSVAAVRQAATSPAAASVHPAPGWLFTSATEAVIAPDTDHALTAVMRQQVRRLTLVITPAGGTADRVAGITGTLSGVAATLDIATGTHAAPSEVALTFSEITSGADAGRWSATVRLLGTAGTEQTLTATIRFAGGSPADNRVTSDISAALASFNDDKRTPLTLGGTVVETPTEAGFGSTIGDWTPGNADGEDIDANI